MKAIDLFAGIGGIRLGFDLAFGGKTETVFVSEWDVNAQKTYSANFGGNPSIAGDITKIDEHDIPPFDICLAGFPCQAFSLAGSRKGFTDDYKGMSRGTLFFDVARICAAHKPGVIFCENVKGLTIHDKGRTFEIIKGTLTELGYTVHAKVLNSRDFGVPQNRERIYIVAFRDDIDSSGFAFPDPTDPGKRLKDIIESRPVSAKYYLSEVYLETLRRHRARHEALGHGFGYEIRDWEDVAGAVVCGGMGRERNLLIDKRQDNLAPVTHIRSSINTEGVRKMTPREWARLQGYPESFELPLADTHMYKQLGNSVSVPVIEAIAKQIKKVLERVGFGRVSVNPKKEVKRMTIKGNKGEWSETYAFLRLLADGRIFAADKNLGRIGDMYFPIKKIIREEAKGKTYEYCVNPAGASVGIYLNGSRIADVPSSEFDTEATRLFSEIKKSTGAFDSPQTEDFMRKIYMTKLKAPSQNKSDINIQIHDINTGYENVVGFSIKSELGSPPTLLNAGKTTNFVYTAENFNRGLIAEINAIDTDKKIIDRMNALAAAGAKLVFDKAENGTFKNNLCMIDSQMPKVVAEMLLGYYVGGIYDCLKLTEHVSNVNPLRLNPVFYKHKVKDMLCSVALGMKPATKWDGTDEASGGYIIVKPDGEVLAFHIYNRDAFKDYLLNSTRLERGGTKKHDYCSLYESDGQVKIKLNLQIRFI